jgi:glyoxylase-like metal-dependent hydrolase (beta-lactamase superfamily II)
VDEIAPDLWRWTRRHPDWHPAGFGAQVSSYALRDAAGLVIVDPLLEGEADPDLAELEALAGGAVRILITIPYHVRSAELIWQRLRGRHETAIHGHARCASRLEDTSGFRAVNGGETLAGGIRAYSIGKPRRMEVPFELPSHRALAFGDAIVETGRGALRVWKQWEHVAAGWYERRFLPTLRPLAELDVERVLVTHGEPVLERGGRALAKALGAPPWSRA